MYTLDANIFARTVHPSQPDYTACAGLLAQLRARSLSIIVPLIVLPEVAAAVRNVTGDVMRARLLASALRALPTIQLIPIDEVLAEAALELAADEGLHGMDAIYVAVAQQHGCMFVTLDADARRRAARVVPALTPAEALAGLP